MTVKYFDSHAHLSGSQLFPYADDLLQRAAMAGVHRIVNICTDALSLEKGLELGRRHSAILNVASTTPHDVEKEGEELFPRMAEVARTGQLVAIGETGLDYHYEHSNRLVQQQFLRRYLRLAIECQLPVVIHCREAFADLFAILDAEYQGQPAILHCFTGTMKEAEGVLERGLYLSLSGIVTYKKSDALREVARHVPLSQLLIETDAPYLAPQSRRGSVNEPAFVIETCATIAAVKRVPFQEVAAATWANGCHIFTQKSI